MPRSLCRPKRCDRLHEPVPFKLAQHILNRNRRPGPGVRDLPDTCGNYAAVNADLVEHEVVRRLRFNAPRLEIARREVLQIPGDDDLSASLDRCRQYVTVFG